MRPASGRYAQKGWRGRRGRASWPLPRASQPLPRALLLLPREAARENYLETLETLAEMRREDTQCLLLIRPAGAEIGPRAARGPPCTLSSLLEFQELTQRNNLQHSESSRKRGDNLHDLLFWRIRASSHVTRDAARRLRVLGEWQLPRLTRLELLLRRLGGRRFFLFYMLSVLERVLSVCFTVNMDDLSCSTRGR